MFQMIRTFALAVLLTPAECRKLYRIDAGDHPYSMEENTVNGFESLTNDDAHNPFSFMAGEFGSSMSFSMSMHYRVPSSPAVPIMPIASPTTHKSGTSAPSRTPSSAPTVSVSKKPSTQSPSIHPSASTANSVEEMKLESPPNDDTRHQATFIGMLVVGGVAGLVAIALLILRAKRILFGKANHSDAFDDASK